jgi:hypothetical protein
LSFLLIFTVGFVKQSNKVLLGSHDDVFFIVFVRKQC